MTACPASIDGKRALHCVLFPKQSPICTPNQHWSDSFLIPKIRRSRPDMYFGLLMTTTFIAKTPFLRRCKNCKAPPGRQAQALAFCYLQHQKDQSPHPKSATASMTQTKRKESIAHKSRIIPTIMATQGSCLRLKNGLFIADTTPFPSSFEGSNDIPLYVWRLHLVPAVFGKKKMPPARVSFIC